jgi:hypothetical protein
VEKTHRDSLRRNGVKFAVQGREKKGLAYQPRINEILAADAAGDLQLAQARHPCREWTVHGGR